MKRKILFLLLFSMLGSQIAFADYEPYQKEEFPQWAHDLRRAEIIFFGSIPLAFFFTSLGFGLYNNIAEEQSQSGLFTGATGLTAEQRIQRITIALSVSGVIALTDYILGRIELKVEYP